MLSVMTLEAESMCVVVYEDIGDVDSAGICFYAVYINLCVVSSDEGIDIALLNLIIGSAVCTMFRSQLVTRA